MDHLTKENFNERTSSGTVLIDFWAEWCGPCKMLMPVLEELEKEHTNVTFCKLATDQNEEIASQFNIMSIPCLILLKDGKEVDRMVGFNPKEKIADWITKYSV